MAACFKNSRLVFVVMFVPQKISFEKIVKNVFAEWLGLEDIAS